MTDSKTREFLKDHPKLLAAMFGLTVLMSQAAPVVAGNGDAVGGT
jgi:hypothetical protein